MTEENKTDRQTSHGKKDLTVYSQAYCCPNQQIKIIVKDDMRNKN